MFVGPFEHTLLRIRDELVRQHIPLLYIPQLIGSRDVLMRLANRQADWALVYQQAASIYSDYYTSEGGNLAFDQTPWFLVVEKLEAEKKVLIAEREKFTAALLQHQVSHSPRRQLYRS